MITPKIDLLKERSDLELLSLCIWGEARGEKALGKLAVAHVVLNRVRARSWYGRTIREVALKPHQFSCFNDDDPNLVKILGLGANDPELVFCRAVAELAIVDRLTNDPTGGATHYHAAGCKPYWTSTLVYLCRIGGHLFYREPRSRTVHKVFSWARSKSFKPFLSRSRE